MNTALQSSPLQPLPPAPAWPQRIRPGLGRRAIRVAAGACLAASLLLPQTAAAAGPTHGDVTFVGGTAAGLASVAGTIFTWGFGAFLEASLLLHTGALWAADKVEVGYVPDASFGALAAIDLPPSLTISSDNLILASDIGAANSLMASLAQSIGAIRALSITLDRQYSAVAAGDIAAALLQRNHALGSLLPALQAATSAADASLAEISSGFTDVSLSSGQVGAYLADVNANGLPSDEQAILALLQTTPAELSAVMLALNTPDFQAQANYSLLTDGLGNARLLMQQTTPYALEFVQAAPVPEPSSLLLVGLALAALRASGARTRPVAA